MRHVNSSPWKRFVVNQCTINEDEPAQGLSKFPGAHLPSFYGAIHPTDRPSRPARGDAERPLAQRLLVTNPGIREPPPLVFFQLRGAPSTTSHHTKPKRARWKVLPSAVMSKSSANRRTHRAQAWQTMRRPALCMTAANRPHQYEADEIPNAPRLFRKTSPPGTSWHAMGGHSAGRIATSLWGPFTSMARPTWGYSSPLAS